MSKANACAQQVAKYNFTDIVNAEPLHYVLYPAAAQTDQTASKLQAANIAVNQAFNAVLDAEKAGQTSPIC